MAITHEFRLTKQSEISDILKDITLFRDNKPVYPIIKIYDVLILYFADSLKWVDSYNPRLNLSPLPQKSLCYYGLTLFDFTQVSQFKSIIKAWYGLFSNAPDKFILTGGWTEIVNEENSGHFDKISFSKTDVLKQLSDLVLLCEKVEQDSNLCLLHWGI